MFTRLQTTSRLRWGAILSPVVFLLATMIATHAFALELAAPFADNAILQREMNVPVWGWATPGEKITVSFAGQKKTATAGKDGKWRVDLDPLKASFEPAVMSISSSSGKTAQIKNILVGEVWMATGQSNMQWEAGKCDVGRDLLPRIAARVEAGQIRRPVVREGKVTDFYAALHPVEHATLKWGSDASEFSAIAAAFAFKLAEELEVPVGILNGSFSTTKIQTWIPRVGFRDAKDDYTQGLYQQVLQTDPTTPQHKAAWAEFYADIEKTIAENKTRVANGQPPQPIPNDPPGNLNGNRDSSWMFNARVNPMVPYAIRGAIWNQGYASMGEGIRYYNNLHSLVRGWRIVWDRPNLPVYFHQFYTPGNGASGQPTMGGASDMRLGTWLARDIPNAGMASQIDIGGGIHYSSKAVPGIRLALQALNKTYPNTKLVSGKMGKDIVADGPMFKSYTVKGNKLIVEFDHADSGLVVGQTDPKKMAMPQVIENGEDQVKLFYIADANRIWYPATIKLSGNKAILTSPKVDSPRGVSYAAGGVSFVPNIYNKAMLPASPFIYYDNKLVTAETWPEEKLQVDGVKIDPSQIGLAYDYRKMPVLSSQFRDNAVLQAGVPVTIWGSAVHPWVFFGAEDKRTEGKAVIHFSFGDVKKTIPITHDMFEWQVTLAPMQATSKPRTLKVGFTIDGELVHERVAENVVIGDVWYVAAPAGNLDTPATDSGQIVRMMTRKAKRSSASKPSRFSVAVSTTPNNRFASEWNPAKGFAAALGHAIAAKTKNPVGIIFMQTVASKGKPDDTTIKEWIAPNCLKIAPSLQDDYQQLMSLQPGNEHYDANARRYIQNWKDYWTNYIPQLMKTGKVPDGVAWGSYPRLAGEVTTKASQTYNVMTYSFTPAAIKGIVFMPSPFMVSKDQGQYFGEQVSALANCLYHEFGSNDAKFFGLMPAKALAPKITGPTELKAPHEFITSDQWLNEKQTPAEKRKAIVDTIVDKAYP